MFKFILATCCSDHISWYINVCKGVQDGSPQQLASSLAAAFSHMPQLAAVRLLSCNMSAPAARLIAAPLAGAALTSLSLNRAFWDQQVRTSL